MERAYIRINVPNTISVALMTLFLMLVYKGVRMAMGMQSANAGAKTQGIAGANTNTANASIAVAA